jgi:ABC-type Na+ efflux pump permease subunit
MRDILSIIKKELKGILKNKQMMFQIFVMPCIMILMGTLLTFSVMQGAMDEQNNFKANGYIVNTPEMFVDTFTEMGLKDATMNDVELVKEAIQNGKIDILIVFPEDFELSMNPEELSNVEMWYNSAMTNSLYAQQYAIGILDAARPSLFTVNDNNPESYDLIKEDDLFVTTMAMFFPMYSIMGIFVAVVAIAAESIVGDKERGFMNMLLITPVKRKHIALGKAGALFIVNFLSAFSVLLGVIISSIVYQSMDFGGTVTWGFTMYLNLYLCALVASFAITSLCLIVSTLSKTIKQANSTCSLLMIVLSLSGLAGTIPGFDDLLSNAGKLVYIIPVFNSNICMQNIINSNADIVNIFISCGVNLAFAITMTMLAARSFDNEAIMQN